MFHVSFTLGCWPTSFLATELLKYLKPWLYFSRCFIISTTVKRYLNILKDLCFMSVSPWAVNPQVSWPQNLNLLYQLNSFLFAGVIYFPVKNLYKLLFAGVIYFPVKKSIKDKFIWPIQFVKVTSVLKILKTHNNISIYTYLSSTFKHIAVSYSWVNLLLTKVQYMIYNNRRS